MAVTKRDPAVVRVSIWVEGRRQFRSGPMRFSISADDDAGAIDAKFAESARRVHAIVRAIQRVDELMLASDGAVDGEQGE